jgi:hypothetical protein
MRSDNARIGILVSHPDHVEYALLNHPNAALVTRSQVLIEMFPDLDFEYFYKERRNDSSAENLIINFSDKWYRDENGFDRNFKCGFSIPQVLTGSIRIGAASILREFLAFRDFLNRFEQILVNQHDDQILLRVAGAFESTIQYYDPPKCGRYWGEWLQERKLRDFLGNHLGKFSVFILKALVAARNFIFSQKYLGKVLVFSDWTNYENPILQNCIWTNHRNPLKSALVFTSNYSNKVAFRLIRDNALIECIQIHCQEIQDHFGLANSDELTSIIREYIVDLIETNKETLCKYISQLIYLFETYQPRKIVIPAELFEPFTVAIQTARLYSTDCILMVDGHDAVGDSVPSLRDSLNLDLLVSNFVVSSSVQYQNAISMGFPEAKIITQDSIFYFLNSNIDKSDVRYDLIVLTWIPNHQNPNARNDAPTKALFDVVSYAANLFKGRIGIKVKNEILEMEYVTAIVDYLGIADRTDVLTGSLKDHLMTSNLFIGGFSSAIAECALFEKRYLVYEPFSNGYGEMHTERPCITENFRIARDVTELGRLIQEGANSLTIDRDVYLKCDHRIQSRIV